MPDQAQNRVQSSGTDLLRSDPEYDMGITGAMKIAHLGEAFGIDVEVHASGPAHRHVMATMRNTNFYEVALVGPDCPNAVAPVYRCGYSDQLDCVGEDGCVSVPIPGRFRRRQLCFKRGAVRPRETPAACGLSPA